MSRPELPSPAVLARIALVALAYFLSAKGGLTLAVGVKQVTPVWPPTGLALAALVIWGPQVVPGVVLGAFAANATTSEPALVAGAIALGNTLEAVVGWWLLGRVRGFRASLGRKVDVLALLGLAGVLSTLVSATIGVLSLRLGGLLSHWDWDTWRTWWFGDIGGNVLLAPLLLVLADGWNERQSTSRPLTAIAVDFGLLGVVAGAGIVVFVVGGALPYVLIPITFVVAVRMGLLGATLVNLLVSALAIICTAHGLGPFDRYGEAGDLLHAQTFSAVVAVTSLLIAASTRERDDAVEDLATNRQLTAQLREAEERQRLLLSSLPDAIIGVYDANLRCVQLQGSILTDAGVDPARYIGRPLAETLAPEESAQLRALIVDALNGTSGSIRYESRRSGLTFDLDAAPYRQADGTIIGAFAVGRNVTAKLEREAELRRLATIVEQSADAITSKANDGTITAWNRAAERLYGYSAEEALGRHISILVPPSRAGEDQMLLDRALAGETVEQFETERIRRDGSIVEVQITISPVRDAMGVPVGASAVTRDITSSKQAERALRESEAQFRSLFENSVAGMAQLDLDGRMLRVNAALCEMVGYRADELLGHSFTEITHPDDVSAGRERLTRMLAGEISFARAEKRYVHRSGDLVWVHLSVSLVRDSSGQPSHLVSQITDITAECNAREALVESERRFHSMAFNMPGMVYRFAMAPDGELSLPFASNGSHELYGVSPEVLMADVGLAFNGVDPADLDELNRAITASAETLSRWEWTGHHRSPDGTLRYLHGMSQPVRQPDGTVTWDGVMLDETEIHRAQQERAEAHRRLQLILDNLPGSAVALYDADLRLQFCEGPLFPHLDVSGMLGRRLIDIADESLAAVLLPAAERALAGHASSTVVEADRLGRTLGVHFAPYQQLDGIPDGVLVHWTDLSAVRAAERDRDEALEHFQVAFDRAPIGMVMIGLDGRFQRVNDAFSELTGFCSEDLLAMAPFAIVSTDDVTHLQREFCACQRGPGSVTMEHRIVHASGHSIWVNMRATMIHSDAGQPLHILAQVLDISERRHYEDRLKHMADHDPLTGLLNRRGFGAGIDQHLNSCRRYGAHGALLILDLDGFKLVNDTLGHAAGDQLIVSCAQALSARLRETDVVARLGGDEFAVILPEEDREAAEAVAQSLIATIAAVAEPGAESPARKVTASVGIAMFSRSALSADEMLVRGDLAMYEAKEAGKNGYVVYSTDGQSVPRITAQMTWLDRIERALAEDRFALYAQPILNLDTREPAAHEILLRMVDEHGDLIPPGAFLPIAEQFGLMPRIDRWVLTRSIRAMVEQHEAGRRLRLAVNISGTTAGDPAILAAIAEELIPAGIAPGDLIVELTETAAVSDIPRVRQFVEALSKLGCSFALDDFGAGFGSFYYLKHLPFDIIKIDGEFVQHARHNPADRMIIQAVTDLAHGLGKTVTAEFVPDEETIELLREHHVDAAQGYYLGRPRPLTEVCAPEDASLAVRNVAAE